MKYFFSLFLSLASFYAHSYYDMKCQNQFRTVEKNGKRVRVKNNDIYQFRYLNPPNEVNFGIKLSGSQQLVDRCSSSHTDEKIKNLGFGNWYGKGVCQKVSRVEITYQSNVEIFYMQKGQKFPAQITVSDTHLDDDGEYYVTMLLWSDQATCVKQ